jgi:hypothetical protein
LVVTIDSRLLAGRAERGGNLATLQRIDQEDSRLGRIGEMGRGRSLRNLRLGKMAKRFLGGVDSVTESTVTFLFVVNPTVSKG